MLKGINVLSKMFAHPSLNERSIVNVRLLRGLINFARWREQKYQISQGTRGETDEREQTLSAITDKNKQLADSFVSRTQRKQSEQPQMGKLAAEIKQL